jgi:predicted TIM-barrel fold metal-dependent hydrolase
VTELGFKLFDGDSHLYEQEDAFSRYMPAEYRESGIRIMTNENGHTNLYAGDRRMTITDSTGERNGMVPRPGSLKEFLRKTRSAEGASGSDVWVRMEPAFQYREERIKALDLQQVEASIVFPGYALTAEPFIDDVDVLYIQLHAYNEWLDEEWGFNYADRIYAPALITLRDLDRSIKELDWLIGRGVRMVMLLTGPFNGRSPADTYFDPFWARLNEAGVVLTYHTSEAIYTQDISRQWGEDVLQPRHEQTAWQWMNTYGERPVMDTLSSLVFWNIFGRFPRLKVIAVEFGAEWLPHFLSKMDKSRGMGRNGPWPGGPLKSRPSEIFAEHGRVVPFPEDDIDEIVRQVGPNALDILVMGSDFPHAEGVAEPALLAHRLASFSPSDVRHMMYENGRKLLPVSGS